MYNKNNKNKKININVKNYFQKLKNSNKVFLIVETESNYLNNLKRIY